MKNKGFIYLLALLIGITMFATPLVSLASTVTGAKFYGTVRVTNNGTSAKTDISTVVSINTTSWIANGTINDSATNIAIRNSTGDDIAFMPYDAIWSLFVSSIGGNTNKDYTLYTSNVTGGKIRIFTDSDGMEIIDDASMEIGDNGTMSYSGYVDTSTAGIIFEKENAITVESDGAGNANVTVYGMADYPVVEATNTSSVANDTSHAINMPAGIQAGDLLVIIFVVDGAPTITHTGWQQASEDLNGDSSTTMGIYYKTATGGDTATFTTSVAEASVHACYRISGWSGTPEVGTKATGSSTSPNPPNLAPTWATPYKTMWLAVYGADGNTNTTVLPTGYTDNISTTGDVVGNSFGSARIFTTASSENPGTFTVGTSRQWVTQTIAVHGEDVTFGGAVSSGEHDFSVGINNPFLGMAVDGDLVLPVSDNLVLNAPLYQSECSDSPFTTIDENELTATVTGATWSSAGYSYDGGDYITITSDTPIQLTTNASIAIWYKQNGNASAANANICGFSDFRIYQPTAATPTSIKAYCNTASGAVFGPSITPITADTYYYIVITYDGSYLRTYKNATQIGTGVAQTLALANNTNNWYIGGGIAGNIVGGTGEVQIYDRALTQSEITQNYNASKYRYLDTGTNNNIYSSANIAIPDNASSWVIGSDATPYIEYYKHYVDGTLVSSIAWQYSTTFTDLSGNGNDATPSFRTTSSDADVSASLINFKPVTLAEASSTASTWPSPFDAPDAPATAYTEDTAPGFFFEPLFALIETLSEGSIPESLLWYLFAFFWIWFVGVMIFYAFAKTSNQSALIFKIVGMVVMMAFFATEGINVYGFYVVIYFVLFSSGVAVLSKIYGW